MSLTNEQKLTFSQKGFIVLKGFIDTDAISRISAWLDELQAGTQASDHAAKYYEKSPITGENILVRVEHVLGEHDPEIAELLLGGKTRECLEQLFGEAPLLFKEKINYKHPGCRADKLHQDQAAAPGRRSPQESPPQRTPRLSAGGLQPLGGLVPAQRS